MALKAVSTSQRFLYVRIAPSGRLKQMSICNSGTPSEFLIRLPARYKIDVFSLMEERFVVELFLSDLQVIEEPPGADSLTGGGLDDPEVLSDPDIVTYSMFIEPSNPFLSDELPVCDKAVNAVGSEQSHEPFQDFPSFVPIGVAPLWKKAENQRKRYPFIGYSQHEDVDVERSELPVGTVHAQHKTDLDRQQREYHPCDHIEVKRILGKESLKPSEVGILVHRGWHGICQLMEADCLHHTERMKKICHELYTRQIHCLPKMLLHNREDLVNFDQVLGISSFHGEKSPNFSFKLLNFRDFCKFNQLKIKCLTA